MISLAANDERRLALERDRIEFSLLLELGLPAGTVHWSCSPWPITIGSKTYARQRALKTAAVPDQREQLGADSYALEFADPDGAMRRRFTDADRTTGVSLVASLVFRKADRALHLSPLVVYRGRSASVASGIGGDGAVTVVTFGGEFASPRRATRYLTRDDQRRIDEDDDALDEIATQRVLKWGARA